MCKTEISATLFRVAIAVMLNSKKYLIAVMLLFLGKHDTEGSIFVQVFFTEVDNHRVFSRLP